MAGDSGADIELAAQLEMLRKLPRGQLFAEWVLGNALAAGVGGILAFPVALTLAGLDATINGFPLGLFLADALIWGLVGFAQWYVLQRYEIDVHRGRWIWLTAVAGAGPVSWAIGLLTGWTRWNAGGGPDVLSVALAVLLGVAVGAGVGMAQMWAPASLALGREWQRASRRWIVASAAGMGAGMLGYILFLLGLEREPDRLVDLVWDFATVPAPLAIMSVSAVVTGLALAHGGAQTVPMALLALSEEVDKSKPEAVADRPWSRWRRDARWGPPAAPRRKGRRGKAAGDGQQAAAGPVALPARPGLPAAWWRYAFLAGLILLAFGLYRYVELGRAYASMPLVLDRPEARVSSLAFSPDGATLAAGLERLGDEPGPDSGIRLLEAGSGRLLRLLDTAGADVPYVVFSPDGRLLAGGLDGDPSGTRIWSVADGTLVRELRGWGGRVAFSPDGALLATSAGAGVTLWQVADWTAVMSLAVSSFPGLSFSPDGRLLSAGGELWSVAGGELSHTLSSELAATAFSPDGRLLAGVDFGDDEVEIWRVDEPERVAALRDFRGQPMHVAFSPDGRFLATATGSGDVRLWNTSSWEPYERLAFGSRPLQGDTIFAATAIAFSPGGGSLAIGGYQRIDLWGP